MEVNEGYSVDTKVILYNNSLDSLYAFRSKVFTIHFLEYICILCRRFLEAFPVRVILDDGTNNC